MDTKELNKKIREEPLYRIGLAFVLIFFFIYIAVPVWFSEEIPRSVSDLTLIPACLGLVLCFLGRRKVRKSLT